jgi:hypothetical protein
MTRRNLTECPADRNGTMLLVSHLPALGAESVGRPGYCGGSGTTSDRLVGASTMVLIGRLLVS